MNCLYNCGLIGTHKMPWIAASTDAPGVIILDELGWEAGSPYIVATVEMKTKVIGNGVSQALSSATPDVSVVDMGLLSAGHWYE